MAQFSLNRSAHSAPVRTRWRQLLPWALIVLMLHAWCLAPEPPAPLRSPLPVLQWRLAPPQATGTTGTTAPAETGRHGAGAGAARSVAGKPAAAPTEPAQLPALRWPSSASWHYRLRWQGEEGIAQLEWRLEGDRYSLRLQRQLESRSLPGWHSEGVIPATGCDRNDSVWSAAAPGASAWRSMSRLAPRTA